MSRIGKQPVTIPSGVKVVIEGNDIRVEGPKGKLSYQIAPFISAGIEENEVVFSCTATSLQARANFGTSRSIVNGMVKGVSEGWKKALELNGVGFTAQLKGNVLTLATGYSHKTDITIPAGVSCKAEKQSIELEGADKQVVGQTAATIRKVCPPEPYLGKGIRYAGENVRRKAGKAGAK